MRHPIQRFIRSTLITIASIALLCAGSAPAATFPADRSTDNVLQGNFEAGTSDVFLTNNSNARRVGTGGGGGAQRVNHPVLGFTLPSLGGGDPITNVTFTIKMDTTAVNGAPIGFDMVVCLMNQTNILGFSAADFIETNAAVNATIGNGTVIGLRTAADVTNNLVESFTLTGAALTQFQALYDGAGNPLQPEVWFRLSTSDPIDTTVTANDNDRFNLARSGDPFLVTRSLEITTQANTPPSILVQPQNVEVVLGADQAEFSVSADGLDPLVYQWSFNAGELTGETNDTLIVLNPGAAELGDYSVAITNSLGSTNSASATLSYIAGTITPGDRAAVEGSSISYGVDLPQAATNYTYQWNLDGIAITPAETNAELVLNPVELTDAGDITVDVTFDGVPATSDPVTLLVASASSDYPTTVLADNPLAYWRLGELSGTTASDSALAVGGPYNATYEPTVQLDQTGALLGDTDRAARFSRAAGDRVSRDFTADLNPSGAFSVEAWVLANDAFTTVQRSVLTSWTDWLSDQKYGFELKAAGSAGGNRWRFTLGGFNPATTNVDGPVVTVLEWTHLVGVYDGTDIEIYVNGYPSGKKAVTPSSAFEPMVLGVENPLHIGASNDPNDTPDSFWDGLIDEVAMYGSALTQAQVLEHYAAGLPADAPPTFSLEPGDEQRDIGGEVTFTVAVRAGGEPTYQWQKDGIDISGETSTSLTVTNLVLTDEGGYRVLADVAGNVVTSAVGTLTIRPPSTVLLENFETYSTGLFGNVASADWVLDDKVQTNWWTVGEEGGNQYLRLVGAEDGTSSGQTVASLNLGDTNLVATATNGVPTEGISTVFMRFYYEAGITNNMWWGTTDNAPPAFDFGSFRGSVSSRFADPGLAARGPSPGAFVLATNLSYNTWYNMWQIHDNDRDTMQVYVTTGNQHATLADRLEDDGVFEFGFRMDNASDVSVNPLNAYRLIARIGAGHRVDDIYISTGINLVNPVAPPVLDPLGISLQGGSPEITWTDTGTLQSTDDPDGTWTNLPAATSPYTAGGADVEHFRLRGNE